MIKLMAVIKDKKVHMAKVQLVSLHNTYIFWKTLENYSSIPISKTQDGATDNTKTVA